MVKISNLIRSYNKKVFLYVVLLAVSCLGIFSLSAQVFQSSEPTVVFPAQEEASKAGSGGIYQPFSPFPPSQQSGNNPVLYGPGGDPIGGLPITNGVTLLFLCIIGYSTYKLIAQKKKRG